MRGADLTFTERVLWSRCPTVDAKCRIPVLKGVAVRQPNPHEGNRRTALSMKHLPILPHFCNEPLRCPACVHRFWVWAENYSQRFERPIGKRKRTLRLGC
jgi:hypothetical protein